MGYSKEMLFKIYNDDTGERIEVGMDGDGLDLIEIRQYTDNNKIASRITMTPEQAKLVSEAIGEVVKDSNGIAYKI